VRHYEMEGTKYGILGCLLVVSWNVFETTKQDSNLWTPKFNNFFSQLLLNKLNIVLNLEQFYIIIFLKWFLAICFSLVIVITALADTTIFSKPLGLPTLTTKYNSQLMLYTFPSTLLMALVTAVGDYLVVQWNRRNILNNRLLLLFWAFFISLWIWKY
jgi:hypothetical protein